MGFVDASAAALLAVDAFHIYTDSRKRPYTKRMIVFTRVLNTLKVS